MSEEMTMNQEVETVETVDTAEMNEGKKNTWVDIAILGGAALVSAAVGFGIGKLTKLKKAKADGEAAPEEAKEKGKFKLFGKKKQKEVAAEPAKEEVKTETSEEPAVENENVTEK